MILKYGNYTHQIDECAVAITGGNRFNSGGQLLSLINRWSVRGMLFGGDLADITTKISALEAAYNIQNQDVTLLRDDGVTPTAHGIKTANCLGGVRTDGVNYPLGEGAEYGGLFRTYVVNIEAEIPITGAGAPLLTEFSERLAFSGGGPKFVILQALAGPPIKQYTADFQPYRATQSGRLVGWLNPVPANAPIWPLSLKTESSQVTNGSPKRTGPVGSVTYTEFESTWNYQFEDPFPLVGTPSLWTP